MDDTFERPAPGPPVAVGDPDDPRLAAYRQLNDPARRRRLEAEDGIFVVEGRVAVRQLLGSAYQPLSLLVDERQEAAVPELIRSMQARGGAVYVGSREVVAATVGFPLHRGVVAVARRPPPVDAGAVVAAARGRVVAVLEGVNDHENVGALFRNAAAFGVAGVLLDPSSADPLYRRSVRVSAGHVLSVPFARLTPWPAGLARLRAGGFLVAALAPQQASFPPEPTTPERWLESVTARPAGAGVALLVGAEGPGLSRQAMEAADVVVSIPMAAGVDSLNVATAAAIAFHRLAVGCRP